METATGLSLSVFLTNSITAGRYSTLMWINLEPHTQAQYKVNPFANVMLTMEIHLNVFIFFNIEAQT